MSYWCSCHLLSSITALYKTSTVHWCVKFISMFHYNVIASHLLMSINCDSFVSILLFFIVVRLVAFIIDLFY